MRFVVLLIGLFLTGAAYVSLGDTVSYNFTGYAWHAPYAYNKQKREEYNDFAAGGGVGGSVFDDDGDRHSLYGMIFEDSHYKPQYTAGYAWMRYWGSRESLNWGLGYTVYLFARSDVNHYIPAPMAGLLASARWSLE